MARRAGISAWGLLLTSLILMPVWVTDGFVLSYDMVAVPDQRLQPWMWGGLGGPPRAVPQDVYVSLLDELIPGAILQKVLLSLVLVVAMAGVATLLHPFGVMSQAAGMSAYIWSAYFYERLVIGHWGLLMACAALPWAVLFSGQVRRGRARAAGLLVLVVTVGTWVPTGGVLLVAVAAAVIAWPGTLAPVRVRVGAIIAMTVIQATWLVPAVLGARGGTSSSGVFGLRSDAPGGALLAAVSGSGIWNPSATPGSRAGTFGVVAALVVLALAVVGLRPLVQSLGSAVVAPLALVSGTLLAWAVVTAVPEFAGTIAAVERLPGGGLLRDAQKWLAPWWLLVSLAFGAAAGRVAMSLRWKHAGSLMAGAAALVPLVLLPDLAWGAWGRLAPAQYPGDWEEVADALMSYDDQGVVASLPWSAFRRYRWNGDRVVLDPAPRYFPRQVVTDTTLLIGSGPQVVASDDPQAPALASAVAADDPGTALRALGVGWILLQRDQPPGMLGGTPAGLEALQGVTTVWKGDWLSLIRLDGDVGDGLRPQHTTAVFAGWMAMAVVVMAAAAVSLGRFAPQTERMDQY